MRAQRHELDTPGFGTFVSAACVLSKTMKMALLSGVLTALLAGACRQKDDLHLRYEGTPGLQVPLRLVSDTPAVEAGYEISPTQEWSGWFYLDTGSPVTLIDTRPLGLSEGLYDLSVLNSMGLSFSGRKSVALALSEPETWMGGILGGDLLRFFCLYLDYRGLQGALYTECSDETLSSLEDVAPPAAVPIQPQGGGRLFLDDGAHLDVGPTRIVMEISIEGVLQSAVLDTGASAPVLSPRLGRALLKTLPHRPALAGVPVTTVSGSQDATLLRLSSIALGESELTSVACLWVADPTPFEDLSREVGRSVQILVGGSFLRHFAFSVDYPAKTLTLARYTQTPHIDPNEYHSVGAWFQNKDGEVLVEHVFPYTDAWRQGLQTNDVVIQVDENGVSNVQQLKDLLDAHTVNEVALFTLRRGSETIEMELLIENLLPELHESPDSFAL